MRRKDTEELTIEELKARLVAAEKRLPFCPQGYYGGSWLGTYQAQEGYCYQLRQRIKELEGKVE